MKIQICLVAVFLLGTSCAPLPEEAADVALAATAQKQEQKLTEQLPIEELNTKEIKKEIQEKTPTDENKPEIRSVPDAEVSLQQNEKIASEIQGKINQDQEKIEEPKALPVEEKKVVVEEIKLEEPKALPIEEKKLVEQISEVKQPEQQVVAVEEAKALVSDEKQSLLKSEEKLIDTVAAASAPIPASVELEKSNPALETIEKRDKKENVQVIESKSVSLEEPSKNELDSGDKKLIEEIKENKDEKLIKMELKESSVAGAPAAAQLLSAASPVVAAAAAPESESKREEKKVEGKGEVEEQNKPKEDAPSKLIEEKLNEKEKQLTEVSAESNESKQQESAESNESKE